MNWLKRLLGALIADDPADPAPPPPRPVVPAVVSVRAHPTDVSLFREQAASCEGSGEFLRGLEGDVVTLSAKDCTILVNILLNAGNLLEDAANKSPDPLSADAARVKTAAARCQSSARFLAPRQNSRSDLIAEHRDILIAVLGTAGALLHALSRTETPHPEAV